MFVYQRVPDWCFYHSVDHTLASTILRTCLRCHEQLGYCWAIHRPAFSALVINQAANPPMPTDVL